jgi:hypothetical protein
MDTKHTPGPWSDVKHTFDADANHWTVEVHANSGFIFDLVRECEEEDEYNEHIANARLIAAAPELLDALETLLEEFVNRMDVDYPGERLAQFQPEVKKAEAALRKAKGN